MVKGAGIGAAVIAVFTVLWKIIKVIAEIIAKVLYYLGIWVPLLYLAYGGILKLIFKNFYLFSADTNSVIYLIGFVLTIFISIIITVKNLIFKPFRKLFKKKKDVVEYNEDNLKSGTPEAPKIYRSRVNEGIIVYEYSNRYDLYEQKEDKLVLVSTEFKKKKRWS